MPSRLLHELVSAQAARRPDAVALVDADGSALSYAALDATAAAWAGELAACGVGPGRFVAVALPRSARLAAVLLAVLRCGAAYSVLDPRWPADRMRTILDLLDPPVLVADEDLAGTTPPRWTPGPAGRVPSAPPGPPAAAVEPGDPACVFFTSGTTGPPKGVVSPHRATTRLFAADGPLPFGPRHVMLQAAPTAWDAWSLELWGMLTTGGTSVVVPEHYLLPHTLAAAVAAHGVTTAWLTSSLFNMLVVEEPECFAGLRHVLVGGERLSPEHVRTFLAAHPDVHLLNGYGPVESCVFATVHPVRAADCDVPGGIPIGRPVPGTGMHLLGDELCVSGDGLALRYLGDETSTAHAFPTLDFDGHAVRVFRTGDTGFRDADGTWHFTGRSDRQVKIRGHRIEPDGVEAEAAALPQVASCAAVPLPGALGTYERLALFYTPRPGTGHAPGGDPSGVRAALARTLPRHCVPDLVRAVERLPVTPNGKVDHAALAAYAADA